MSELNDCDVGKSEKHLELHSAINGMLELLNQVRHLRNKINPEPQTTQGMPCDSTVEPAAPSLFELLNDGPSRIRGKCEDISVVISAIDKLLYVD